MTTHRKRNDNADSQGSGRAAGWNQLQNLAIGCQLCPRLIAHCQEIARQRRRAYRDETYWGRPLPNFGSSAARLLIVGLAPAAHGANRTGRMFTGDRSGEWLYHALYETGFANQAESVSINDGLELIDCAITAACRCAPPDNRPTPAELATCGEHFLRPTLALVQPQVIVALGQIALHAVVRELRQVGSWMGPLPRFIHGAHLTLSDGRHLLASYHPSQQNTFTGRLTREMLRGVFENARALIAPSPKSTS